MTNTRGQDPTDRIIAATDAALAGNALAAHRYAETIRAMSFTMPDRPARPTTKRSTPRTTSRRRSIR